MNDVATRPNMRQDEATVSGIADFLAGGGGMGALMRAHDWSASPLGDPSGWPQSLRSVVGLLLNSKFPMFVAWGPELGFLYNDPYAEILGEKHPRALGIRFYDIWSEIWPDISPLIDAAMAGEATYREDLPLLMNRKGFDEQTWFTFSYSPVRDESGLVAGMFCACTETTDRVSAESALRDSEERYRSLFNSIDAGFCIAEVKFDADERPIDYMIVESNPKFEELTGLYGAAGKWVSEIAPTLERHWHETYGRVALTGEPERFENRAESMGRWFDVYAYRVGRPEERRVAILFNDISEQRQIEAELRESEARFRNVADHAPMMMWVTDADGHCTYLNRAWYAFTGQTPEQAEGFGWLDATHPDDKAEAERTFLEANKSRAPFRLEYRLRREDGAFRWAIDAAAPRFGPNDEFLGYVGSVIDIDERRESEDALRDSEARFRTIFEEANDFIFTIGLDYRLTAVNPATAAAIGVPPEEGVGRSVAEFMSLQDFEASQKRLAAKLEGGAPTRYEIEVTSALGERMIWEVNSRLNRTLDGAPLGLHVIGRDVTERKRTEEHLRLLIGELNHRVKNTLAIVQAVARQSLTGAGVAGEVRDLFEGRLQALAAAHNLLTRENWDSADLGDVVRDVTSACHGGEGRFAIEGPPVRLAPKVAVTVAMAVHELCTNAVKYGALSNEAGRVSVKWSTNGRLRLRWEERGGPPVSPPARRGFGSRMIERALASELNAAVKLDWRPEGLVCEIVSSLPERTQS